MDVNQKSDRDGVVQSKIVGIVIPSHHSAELKDEGHIGKAMLGILGSNPYNSLFLI